MLDFRPSKPSAQPQFSLDPAERERARSPLNRRRIWHLISLFSMIIITGWLFYSMLDGLKHMITPFVQPIANELHATAMTEPSLATFPALPSAEAVAAEAENAKEVLASGNPPLWVAQPEAVSLAWLKLRLHLDEEQPPVPQRASGEDLALNHVRAGSSILITGVLEDSRPALLSGSEEGWQVLIVHLDSDQYVELLAPLESAALTKGTVVQATGRYMGMAQLPPARGPGALVRLPLLAARAVFTAKADDQPEQVWTLHGPWREPDDLYAEVDDEMLIMQTRPYYYTLGQVLRDLATPRDYEGAPKATDLANAIYQTPNAYRAKPFVIQGHVFHSWVDPAVAQDHPFGVDRVVRIILWSNDWGPYTDGRGVTTRKLVLRAFEIAAITDQPLPKDGDLITATGRFLRKRALEIKPGMDAHDDPYRRGNNRAYTFFFVTNQYKTIVVPPDPIVGIGGIILTVIVLVLGFLMVRAARKDWRKVEASAEAMRLQRNKRGDRRAAQRAQDKANTGTPVPVPAPAPVAQSSAPPPSGPDGPPLLNDGGPAAP